MFIFNGDHHAQIDAGYFIGNIIAGQLLINDVDAVHTAQRGLYDRHDDIRHQRDTKTEQCGPGVAQCVDFRIQIFRQVLKGGLDHPTITIYSGNRFCAGRTLG